MDDLKKIHFNLGLSILNIAHLIEDEKTYEKVKPFMLMMSKQLEDMSKIIYADQEENHD